MITLADAPHGTEQHCMCPAGVVRDETHFCNDVYVNNNIRHHHPKKQVVKIRNNEADFDSDVGENHTCSRLQKN